MLNEFVAQNRVSAARNDVQSSIRRDVCSLLSPPTPFSPPSLSRPLGARFLFLDTLILSTLVRLFLTFTNPLVVVYLLFLLYTHTHTDPVRAR